MDTLKRPFEGRPELFKGLAIEPDLDWSVRYPVVRLDFGKGNFKRPGYLHANVMAQLDRIGRESGLELRYDTAPDRLNDLIRALNGRCGQRVVILVDEYDNPLLDALEQPEIGSENRDGPRGLYSVSYTERDLDAVFADRLEGLDREDVCDWHHGYSWGGDERVYNPFDVLLLDEREYKNWWFETGTPTFLVEMLVERGIHAATLEGMLASDRLLSSFDVGLIATEALLFQTGYLTVLAEEDLEGTPIYRLGYPNREVRQSLNECLLDRLTGDMPGRLEHGVRLGQLLRAGDLTGLERQIRRFFASIPYQWHARNEIARFEGYYASVFYSYFAGAGSDTRVEESVNGGRLDMAVRAGGRLYLFEFKVVERAGPGAALAQLKERGYADKYRHLGEPVHLVGVEFSEKDRNVAGFEAELACVSRPVLNFCLFR